MYAQHKICTVHVCARYVDVSLNLCILMHQQQRETLAEAFDVHIKNEQSFRVLSCPVVHSVVSTAVDFLVCITETPLAVQSADGFQEQ